MAVIWLALANGFPAWPCLESEGALNGSGRAVLPPTFLLNNSVLPNSPHPGRMSCLCGGRHLRNVPVSCLHRATSSWQTSACARRAFPWLIPPARSAGRQRLVVEPSDCTDSGCEFLKRDFFDNICALLFTSTWLPRSWGSSRTTTRWTGGAWARCCMRCCMVWWAMASNLRLSGSSAKWSVKADPTQPPTGLVQEH